MKISEAEMMTEVIVPYLEENWNSIDWIGTAERGNGRLTREKLFIKYLNAMIAGDIQQALVLEAILDRYEKICLSSEDAYIPEEEEIIGITEADVYAYVKSLNAAKKNVKSLLPRYWLPLKAG